MSSKSVAIPASKPRLRDVMESARLKVKRANRHIDEIIADQSALPNGLYNLGVSHWSVAVLREPDCDLLTYAPKDSISKHFGAIAGDAVNNLRESLDLWVNAAALCVGPKRKLHFPFSKERKNLESAKAFGPVKKAFPDAANFIAKDIEPCGDTNLHLWAATSLCNDNKHNDFVPIVALSQIKAPQLRVGTSIFDGARLGGDANHPQKLVRAPYKSITVKGDFEVSVEISFPKGAVFEDEPVVPTLLHMSQVVSKTLDALEVFIQPYCR